MKKILLLTVAALSVAGFIFAQNYGTPGPNGNPGDGFERPAQNGGGEFAWNGAPGWPRGPNRHRGWGFERFTQNDGEALTLNGTLIWANGRIALKSGDKTYFISGIRELLGFVDGLKEGAQLTLTGRAYDIAYIPEYGIFRTEKVTFKGKEYPLENDKFGGMMHGRRF